MKRPYLIFGAALMAGTMLMSCGNDDVLQLQTQEALENLTQQIEDLKLEQEQMRKELDDLSPIGQIFDNNLVDQPAVFPGGPEAMLQYIADNLKYPESALQIGMQGRVIVKILVDKTGVVKSCTVLRGIEESCDREARRVCLGMPKFTPASHQGSPVSVEITIPVQFRIP